MAVLRTLHATPVRPTDKIPPILLRAMFGLAGLCLVMVTAYTLAGGPKIATPPEAEVIASRVIWLSGDISGAAQVRDADGTLIADLPPDRGGFIAGIERVVARERTNHRVPLDAPLVPELNAVHRLSIHDPTTDWRADLMGFGADNARAFAKLLD